MFSVIAYITTDIWYGRICFGYRIQHVRCGHAYRPCSPTTKSWIANLNMQQKNSAHIQERQPCDTINYYQLAGYNYLYVRNKECLYCTIISLLDWFFHVLYSSFLMSYNICCIVKPYEGESIKIVANLLAYNKYITFDLYICIIRRPIGSPYQ